MATKNCGCISDRCTCYVRGQAGVSVTGSGGVNGSFTVSALGGETYLEVEDSPTIHWTITGDGSQATPYHLSGEAVLSPASASTVQFTANGTWNRPAGTSMIHIIAIGGGGGGGGGLLATTADQAHGGGGGGAGGYAEYIGALPANLTTLPVVVGTGGTGGSAGTIASTPGDGLDGGVTRVGNLIQVGGGKGGYRAVPSPVQVVAAGAGGYGQPEGAHGGVPSTTASTSGVSARGLEPSGGGAGQFTSSFGPSAGGAQPGDNKAGGVAGAAGVAGSDFGGGTGGGGGTLSGTTGTIGGIGGARGAGGGGGAAVNNSAGATTAGAAGSAGYVRIYAW